MPVDTNLTSESFQNEGTENGESNGNCSSLTISGDAIELVPYSNNHIKKILKKAVPYGVYAVVLSATGTISVLLIKEAGDIEQLASMPLIGMIVALSMSAGKGAIDASYLLVSRLRKENKPIDGELSDLGDDSNLFKVGEIVRIGYATALTIGVLIAVSYRNIRPVIEMFSVHPEIVDNVERVFDLFAYAAPAVLWLTASQKTVYGFGRPVVSACIGSAYALLGLPLEIPLVLLEHKGLIGMVAGAIFSSYVVSIASTIYLKLDRRYDQYELFSKRMTNLRGNLYIFLKLAAQLGFQDATEHISSLFMGMSIGTWLEPSLATQVTERPNSFVSGVIAGSLSIAAGSLVAGYLGKAERARRLGNLTESQLAISNIRTVSNTSMLLGCAPAALVGLSYLMIPTIWTDIFIAFPDADVDSSGVLINEERTRALALNFSQADSVYVVSNVARVIAMGALNGYEDVIIPTLISFIFITMLAFPICWWLVFADGEADADRAPIFYWGRTLANTAAAGLISARLFWRNKNELQVIQQEINAQQSETDDSMPENGAKLLGELSAIQNKIAGKSNGEETSEEKAEEVKNNTEMVV